MKVGVYSYWQARGIWRIPERRGTSAHSPVTGSITRVRPPAETQHTQQFCGVHNVLSSDCCHARNTNQASHLVPATVHSTSPRDSAYMKLWKLLDFAISEASPSVVLKIQSLALLHAAQIWPINDTAAKYLFCNNTAEPQVIRAHTSKQLFRCDSFYSGSACPQVVPVYPALLLQSFHQHSKRTSSLSVACAVTTAPCEDANQMVLT